MSLRRNFKNKFNQTKDSVLLPELEFHLGHVEKVFTEESDISFLIGNEGLPKVGDVSQVISITPSKSLLPTRKRKLYAQPLLRGINDSITRGDAVMYVNVEGILFYLGPLNTTNSVNYTPDHTSNRTNTKYDDENGYSTLYPKRYINKLSKPFALDPTPYVPIHESKFTDLTFEGRHGNSIRIGSKAVSPLITISNNRFRSYESTSDGSNISMFSNGSLRQHFLSEEGERYNPSLFLLSSDRRIGEELEEIKEGQYSGYLLNFGNDSEEEVNEDVFDYEYSNDQMIMFSNRITFNAQNNDLTFSAFRNINFGAGRNLTITNKGFSVIESKNIYIGKASKNREQPLVLGEELRKLLLDMMNLFKNANALVQGVPLPLVDSGGAPLLGTSIVRNITTIIQELEKPYEPGEVSSDRTNGGGPNFFSNHHFIEPNRT